MAEPDGTWRRELRRNLRDEVVVVVVAVEDAMVLWLERNPQDRFGMRPYSLDAYGVTTSDLEPIFGEYLSSFHIEIEGA